MNVQLSLVHISSVLVRFQVVGLVVDNAFVLLCAYKYYRIQIKSYYIRRRIGRRIGIFATTTIYYESLESHLKKEKNNHPTKKFDFFTLYKCRYRIKLARTTKILHSFRFCC